MARLLLRPPRYCKTYQTFLLDRIVEHAAKERPVVFAIALVTACSRVRSEARLPHPRHWDELVTPVQKRPLKTIDKTSSEAQSSSTGTADNGFGC